MHSETQDSDQQKQTVPREKNKCETIRFPAVVETWREKESHLGQDTDVKTEL